MKGAQRFSLAIGPPVLRLEVRRHPLDLGGPDLLRSQQNEVDRLPVLTDQQLDVWLPNGVRLPAQPLDERELPRVAERWRRAGIGPNHGVETDGPATAHRVSSEAFGSPSSTRAAVDHETPARLAACRSVIASVTRASLTSEPSLAHCSRARCLLAVERFTTQLQRIGRYRWVTARYIESDSP